MAMSDDEIRTFYSQMDADKLRRLRETFAHELQFVVGMASHRFCLRRIDAIDAVLRERGLEGP